MLSWAGFALAASALAYAANLDLRERKVSDAVWLISYPAATVILVLSIAVGSISIQGALASILLSAGFAAAFYALGFIGGADAFAVILVGLAVPRYPDGAPLLHDPIGLPVFSAICNSALLSMLVPASILAANILDILRGRNPLRGVEVRGALQKCILLLTARRVRVEDLEGGLMYFPAERLEGGKRVPILFMKAEQDFEGILSEMREKRHLYEGGVLASPTIPMVFFLLLGLVALPIFGNAVLSLLSLLL